MLVTQIKPASDSTAAQPASVSQATLATAAQPSTVTNSSSTVASITGGMLHMKSEICNKKNET